MFIASAAHVAHDHKYRGSRWTEDKNALASMTKKVAENMNSQAGTIEKNYFEGPWALG